jgi:hypothetical protein
MRALVILTAALSLAACGGMGIAPQTGTAPIGPSWIRTAGILYHRPRYAASRSEGVEASPLYVRVPYLGGAVVLAPKVYFTFWGYKKFGDPDKAQALLEAYAKAMGGSGHNNIETQYYQGSSGSRAYIQNPKQQYGGSWNDESGVPNKPTDLQVAAEALKAVNHFGFDANGVYVIATGHKHSEVGFPAHWCAYHSSTFYNKQAVPYSYFPYIPDGGSACGANFVTPPKDESGTDEGVTIMAGHEFGEVITDPTPSTAWDGPGGEIGDECYWHGIANEPFGSKSYTMQPMASNADNACVQSYN